MTADGEREESAEGESDENHLDAVEDGAGCAEIWERLSEFRED